MRKYLLLCLAITLSSFGDTLFAQQTVLHPTSVRQAVFADVTPPLREMKLIPPKKGKTDPDREIKNRIGMKEFNHLQTHPFLLPEDPVWQKQDGTYVPAILAPIQNFDGINNLLGYYPPDTQGDVGPDKYLQVVNCNFAVYSKTGSTLLGPALLSSIWTGIPAPYAGTNNGDPVVLYDQASGRWIISEFSLPSTSQHAELVAVSQTSDPTGSWYRYIFEFGNRMPDYPKFGVWPDAYYLSFNQFINETDWGGVGAVALERSKMLTGDASARMVYFDLGSTSNPGSMLPSDWDGTTPPVANEPNYFTFFDDWSSTTTDYLKIWQFHVDWATTSNSTFSESYSLETAAFKSAICTSTTGACIPQPGTTVKLDDLSDRLMYRLQYRNFGGYRAMVTNHAVDADGTSHAGIRWYELRNTGTAWTIYQQGTYAPDANHRWMGSIAMNASGDIALGYSVSAASTVYPSIRYTGRRVNDPLNQMTIAEQTIIAGTGSQTGSAARWGDYSMMSVDPTDDLTFWFTTEYVQTTGSTTWRTRIASFKFSNNPGVTTLAASAVTGTAATLNGTINPNGLASTYHFEWGTTISYGNSTTVTSAGSGTGSLPVNANISGLTAATTYHFRLVGVNSDGTTNGNDMTFIPGTAAVTTTAASSITTTSASSGGNVLYDGGFSVSAHGVCWGSSANPTVSGSHTTDGTGTGTYTSSLTGLTANTTYHIRAYATNANGTYYGDDLTFTTLCGLFTLPFSESFATTSIPSCWSQVDHQGNGQIWQFGTITGQSPNPVLTAPYAYLNSDAYGNGNSQNADLITPLMDLSAYATVSLQFKNYFKAWSGSSGSLSYSINGGTTWMVIQNFTTTSATNPVLFNQAVNAVAGQAQVKFKWNYTGSFGYSWAIDDIQVTGTILPSLSVSPSNQNVAAAAGSTGFTVTSNSAWTASSNQTWCTPTLSGTGNGAVTANYTQNLTASQRVASITVTVTGLTPVVVTVTQAAGTTAVAPITTAGTRGSANNSPVTIPVTVTGFTGITALSLRLDYNPTLLTYTGFANTNALLTGLIVNDMTVSGTLHKIMMTWTDITPRTIASGGKIVDLNFTYISGTTALAWNNSSSGGSECEYADAGGNPLPDIPTATYYINGEVHPQPGFAVTGNFKYNNTANTVLDNVKVVLQQGTSRVDSATTDVNGNYGFASVPNGTYKVLAYTSKPWGSVNATDAAKVQRHFSGEEILIEPVRLLAADVNLSNSINGTDAIKIKRRFAGLDTYFDRGDWTFARPSIGGDTIIVSGGVVSQDFYGLCVGDVNGSNVPSAGKSEQSKLALVQDGEMVIAAGQEFDLPVRIDREAELGAVSLVFQFPADLISIRGITMKSGSPVYKIAGDQLRIAWSELEPLMLMNRDELITLKLKASESLSSMKPFMLSVNNESELANSRGEVITDATLTAPVLKTFANSINTNGMLDRILVYPNPAGNQVNIEYQANEACDVTIDISSVYGQTVVQHAYSHNVPGRFVQAQDISNVSGGDYIVKIKYGKDGKEFSRTFKLVKLK